MAEAGDGNGLGMEIVESSIGFSLQSVSAGRKSDQDDLWLFEDLSFAITDGERISLGGATGSGKSLFMRALAQLDSLDKGQILWNGAPVEDSMVPSFRAEVIYLHQSPGLFPGTVEENLKQPFNFAIHSRKSYEPGKIDSYLDKLNRSSDFLDKAISSLSGGERQLVSLLRAIQLEPRILLLDEPTAALDPDTTSDVERLVSEWFENGESLSSYLWISHDQSQRQRVSDKRFKLADGKMELVN